jgi:predicted acyltransferase
MSTYASEPAELRADLNPPPAATFDYAPPALPSLGKERLVSLDALRGFDMFWILGADTVIEELGKINHSRAVNVIVKQGDHVPWEGFHFYDLIFPLFVFIVGVSLVFSLSKIIARGGKKAAVKRIIIRFFALYIFGLLYYGGFDRALRPDFRYMGVLQRIALCYLAAGLLFIFFRPRTLAIIAASLLLLYWGLMTLVPVPKYGRANFEEGKNFANYVDRVMLPGYKWDGDHDPEGLLSNLPAIAGCLLGVFAGLLLKNDATSPWKKVGLLLGAGAASLALGMAWGGMFHGVHVPGFVYKLRFPVIKKLWTSSFVLLTVGYAAILLALFYLVIDVLKIRFWAAPFVWIGMNAITLYLIHSIANFSKLADRLVGGPVGSRLHGSYSGAPDYHPLAREVIALIFVLLLARFLYKRQVFLRL